MKDTLSLGDSVFLLNTLAAGSRTYSPQRLCGLGLHLSHSSLTRPLPSPDLLKVLLTIFTLVRVFALPFTVSMGWDIVLSTKFATYNILPAFDRFWFTMLKLETKEETIFFWLRLLGSALVYLLPPCFHFQPYLRLIVVQSGHKISHGE